MTEPTRTTSFSDPFADLHGVIPDGMRQRCREVAEELSAAVESISAAIGAAHSMNDLAQRTASKALASVEHLNLSSHAMDSAGEFLFELTGGHIVDRALQDLSELADPAQDGIEAPNDI